MFFGIPSQIQQYKLERTDQWRHQTYVENMGKSYMLWLFPECLLFIITSPINLWFVLQHNVVMTSFKGDKWLAEIFVNVFTLIGPPAPMAERSEA